MLGAFANAFRTPDLRRKLLFVLFIIALFRLGSQVPAPGVNVANVQACFRQIENDGLYGLNASVYTRDGARGRAIARRIRCGTVNVNEAYGATFGSLGAPMGGMRQSGLGRRQGAEGIHRYTEAQSVGTQRLVPIAPMFGMSEETNATVMTAALRLLNKLGRA